MESTKLPYVVQASTVTKILKKVQHAKTPDRFTIDFLKTVLGFKGGNDRQFISLAKKLNLLNSDGTPTDLYKQFRNSTTAGAAIAKAMRIGFRELFDRNEYAHKLKKEDLKGLIVQVTGLDSKDVIVQRTLQTFEHLHSLADFDAETTENHDPRSEGKSEDAANENENESEVILNRGQDAGSVRLGLAYTINLVLPKTDDAAVFNAIFRSLRDNLLRS